MKRTTLLTLGAAATAAVIAAVAVPAVAHGWGPQQMMRMMQDGEAGAMQGERRAGKMMRQGGHGRMGLRGMADSPVYQSFDTDADGKVTAAELEAGLADLHGTHDADGDGALSSDEFASLFAEATRNRVDRPFTMLDADADGQISAEEMAFPAQIMRRMERVRGTAPDQQ